MKKCAHCQQTKELKFFRRRSNQKDGLDYNCRECSCQQSKESKYRIRYGITLHEKTDMLIKQDGLCALCKEKIVGRICVDHNHRTDVVRGILCNSCNIGLGAFYDDVEKLQLAIKYLQQHNSLDNSKLVR
jgi:hypothetical protein